MNGNGGPERQYYNIPSARSPTRLPYQVFAMQKVTERFTRNHVRHPYTRRELVGVKLMPQLTDELSLQLEAMGQIGRNGDGGWTYDDRAARCGRAAPDADARAGA